MKSGQFRPRPKNSLLGFFDLMLDSGLILRGCALHLSHGKHWVGLPARPYTEPSGAATWAAIVDFRDRRTRDSFQQQATAAALSFRQRGSGMIAADPTAIEAFRLKLHAAGFAPLPLNGKKPFLVGWQRLGDATDHEIRRWTRTRPAETNTGILTRTSPAFDVDILDPEAAAAVERLARSASRRSASFRFVSAICPNAPFLSAPTRRSQKICDQLHRAVWRGGKARSAGGRPASGGRRNSSATPTSLIDWFGPRPANRARGPALTTSRGASADRRRGRASGSRLRVRRKKPSRRRRRRRTAQPAARRPTGIDFADHDSPRRLGDETRQDPA